eukprot:4830153-Pyramimonas_sp.AAC.1
MAKAHHSSSGLLHIDVFARPAPPSRRHRAEALGFAPRGRERWRKRPGLRWRDLQIALTPRG